jgi:glycine/D-amino acid oxidase-like deaminating enzyme
MPAVLSSSGPETLAVESTNSLPAAVDVAIIGGGIIGVSAALWLASRNVSVALFEKGKIAGEQSSRNWGWCRLTGRDLRELPLMLRAHELWRGMNELVTGETGYHNCGIVYASKTLEARERHLRWNAEAGKFGVESRILEPNEVAAITPGLTRRVAGGLFTPADGRAEPQRATSLMAEAAIRRGAQIFQACAVRAIDIAAGRVADVATEHGRVRAATVIVAGGAWSRLLLKGVGARLPQLKVLSSVYRTAPFEAGIEPCMSFFDFALRKRLDGGYTIASSAESVAEIVPDTLRFFRAFLPAYLVERKSMKLTLGRAFVEEALRWHPGHADRPSIYEAVRILDPKPDEATLARVKAAIGTAIPSFRDVLVAQSWAGMIDTTPDAIPVISPVESVPGLIVGAGFSGHGFGIGPAAGEMLADLAMGRKPASDPYPFRFSRFTDGERLDLQTWL